MNERGANPVVDVLAAQAAAAALNELAAAADRARVAIDGLFTPAQPVGILHVDGKLNDDQLHSYRDLMRSVRREGPRFDLRKG